MFTQYMIDALKIQRLELFDILGDYGMRMDAGETVDALLVEETAETLVRTDLAIYKLYKRASR